MSSGVRDRVIRHVDRDDLPYRLRGEHHTRLEAFSDAVIAFAITLSVVSLEVPKDSHELLLVARGGLTFLATFAVLFTTWLHQNRFFRRYGLDDNRTLTLNGAILFVVVFYTYPLKFILAHLLDPLFGGEGPVIHPGDQPGIFLFFGCGLSAMALLFHLLYRHAWGLRDVLELDEYERLDTRLQMGFWFSQVPAGVVFALSAPLLLMPKTPLRRALAMAYIAALFGSLALVLLSAAKAQRERKGALAKWRAAESAREAGAESA